VTGVNIDILGPSVNGADSGSATQEIVTIVTDNVVLDTMATLTAPVTIARGTPIWVVCFVGTY